MTEGGSIKQVKIHIRGQIDEDWAEWFEGLEVQTTGEGTILRAEVTDQSALYGILAKLRDLGLELISVEQVD